MLRSAITLAVIFASFAARQSQPDTAPAALTPAKPIAKKPAPKTKAVEPTADSSPCKIGVIPIAGDLFLIEKFGPLRLTDTYDHTAVSTWALDDLVVSRVRAAQPGASVRKIPFTREELRSYRMAGSRFPDGDTRMKAFAQYVSRNTSCERYVVVHRYGRSGHKEFGIGISNYLLDRHVYLFAIMYTRVHDGRTFELIKQGPALIGGDSFMDRLENAVGGPYRALDTASFPEKPSDVAANPILRDGVRSLLTASLDSTLPALLGSTR
jgi:hypothetical protein